MSNRRQTLLYLSTLAAPAVAATDGNATTPGRDIRTFPGIVADGVTDDFVALQAAFLTARDTGSGVWWPSGVKTFVQFSRSHPHLFIDGRLRLRGSDRNTCGIVFHCNYDMGNVHSPLFCFGIAAKNAKVNKVTGEISGLGWFLKAGSSKFERCCHIYGADDFTVQDCYADFTAVTWPAADAAHPSGYQAGGWWSSNVQPKFAIGQTRDRDVRFLHNVGIARAEYQNAESIGFSNTDGLQYVGNQLTGWADDLAAHSCTDVTIKDNYYKAVAGRLYLEGCQRARIVGNTVEPCERPLAGGYVGPVRRFIHADMVINTLSIESGGPANEMPNADIEIVDNTIRLPAGTHCTGAIAAWGVQDRLTITGNRVVNSGAVKPVTMISVSTGFRKGWVGPAGNPDANSGGAVRLREVTIRSNLKMGEGWLPNDGTIGVVVAPGGAASSVLGPIVVERNMAGRYYMPYGAIRFGKNAALSKDTDAFLHVAPQTLLVSRDPMWVGQLPSSPQVDGPKSFGPASSFFAVMDAGARSFFVAERPGRICGALLELDRPMRTDNNAVLRLLKNGKQVGPDVASNRHEAADKTPGQYIWNFAGAEGFAVAKGDKIEIRLAVRPTQGAEPIAGQISVLGVYAD